MSASVKDLHKDLHKRTAITLIDLVDSLPDNTDVGNILAADTGAQLIYNLLSNPAIIDALVPPSDSILKARFRGLKRRYELLESDGGSMTTQQASDLLQVERQTINKRITQGLKNAILGVQSAKHGYWIPVWQFDGSGNVLPGLSETLLIFRDKGIDGWSQLIFFLSPDLALDNKRPLDVLRAGNIDAVLNAAKFYGEQTAY